MESRGIRTGLLILSLISLTIAVPVPAGEKALTDATSAELGLLGISSTESFRDSTTHHPTSASTEEGVLRWHSPCHGGEPAVSLGGGLSISVPTQGYLDHYNTLLDKSDQAQKKLIDLKNKFIKERFDGDQEHVEQLLMFYLNGMPSTENSISTIESNNKELESARIAYEDLARVAVFLEQARLDERRYESEASSYANIYQEIEEQAIYWLLCQLQKFIHELGEDDVNVRVTREIMAMQLRTASSRALRHNRDFIIIRDSLLILQRFYNRFDILKQTLETGTIRS